MHSQRLPQLKWTGIPGRPSGNREGTRSLHMKQHRLTSHSEHEHASLFTCRGRVLIHTQWLQTPNRPQWARIANSPTEGFSVKGSPKQGAPCQPKPQQERRRSLPAFWAACSADSFVIRISSWRLFQNRSMRNIITPEFTVL